MESALTTVGLPIALAIVMFGLGLDLTPRDFARVGRAPRAAVVALLCQLVLMPAAAFGRGSPPRWTGPSACCPP